MAPTVPPIVADQSMSSLDQLRALLGEPAPRQPGADDWAEVERYAGSALPGDFKAFLDAYGTGVISGELVVFHPRGSAPLPDRMARTHQEFAQRRDRAAESGVPEHYPYAFHPAPGGLISWGYDHSGDEHFFLPCDADPDRWKVVTMVHEVGCQTFDGSFSAFVLSFVERLASLDRLHGLGPQDLEFLEPEDLAELVADGEIGPTPPGFEPC
ncbi:SMI1/KNR4 family protein [Actinacidiphila glaucinigra]|nr:SMI1/KNR4 family protein [Actinacidiphila glaucinigra]